MASPACPHGNPGLDVSMSQALSLLSLLVILHYTSQHRC